MISHRRRRRRRHGTAVKVGFAGLTFVFFIVYTRKTFFKKVKPSISLRRVFVLAFTKRTDHNICLWLGWLGWGWVDLILYIHNHTISRHSLVFTFEAHDILLWIIYIPFFPFFFVNVLQGPYHKMFHVRRSCVIQIYHPQNMVYTLQIT